jgi:hypothetical protein
VGTMKSCGYCGRENDDPAASCHECGTSFPVSSDHLAKVPPESTAAPWSSRRVSGGLGVILICSGVVLATSKSFPALYAFGLFLDIWLFVLAIAATALALYAGTICCDTQWSRVVFTFVVMGILALGGWGLLRAVPELSSQGSPAVVYGGAASLVLIGAFLLARLARRKNRSH